MRWCSLVLAAAACGRLAFRAQPLHPLRDAAPGDAAPGARRAEGPIMLVQTANAAGPPGTGTPFTYSATLPSPVAAGDLVAGALWWHGMPGAVIVRVTDSDGHSYALAVESPAGNDANAWIYYAVARGGAAADQV